MRFISHLIDANPNRHERAEEAVYFLGLKSRFGGGAAAAVNNNSQNLNFVGINQSQKTFRTPWLSWEIIGHKQNYYKTQHKICLQEACASSTTQAGKRKQKQQ